jgi:hypothetical protein
MKKSKMAYAFWQHPRSDLQGQAKDALKALLSAINLTTHLKYCSSVGYSIAKYTKKTISL